jgi:rhodanese-related sulfurtransferase
MIDQIRPAQLSAWIERVGTPAQPAVVLDVREPWERQTATVKPAGFTLLSIPMGELPARLSELSSTAPLACLCHHGARSQRVALFLAHNGFDQVVNIAGGIDAWSAELDVSVPRY